MNKVQALEIIINSISEVIGDDVGALETTPLIGSGSLLDSMKLVELCLLLEDLADESGFEFDWTSDATMSKSRSMFRDVGSLAEEFSKQSEN